MDKKVKELIEYYKNKYPFTKVYYDENNKEIIIVDEDNIYDIMCELTIKVD